MRKRLFDFGWSDEIECLACRKEKDTEKHRRCHCPEWHEIRREIPGAAYRKWEQKTKPSKKEWKLQKGIVTHLLSESQWNRGHFSMRKWESEKHKSWGMPAEGFMDRSLPGRAGKWGACDWAVVQLDSDEEIGPLHGMYGSMEAELEVQLLCLLKRVIDGLRRREREWIKPRAGDADLWIKIWEELRSLAARDITVEVEHAKSHRTKKEKKEMSHFEKFVTEGNEKADELAKEGAMLDDGYMAKARA